MLLHEVFRNADPPVSGAVQSRNGFISLGYLLTDGVATRTEKEATLFFPGHIHCFERSRPTVGCTFFFATRDPLSWGWQQQLFMKASKRLRVKESKTKEKKKKKTDELNDGQGVLSSRFSGEE